MMNRQRNLILPQNVLSKGCDVIDIGIENIVFKKSFQFGKKLKVEFPNRIIKPLQMHIVSRGGLRMIQF